MIREQINYYLLFSHFQIDQDKLLHIHMKGGQYVIEVNLLLVYT